MLEIKLLENKVVCIDKDLDKEAGICEFSIKDNTCNIYHTEVKEEYRGKNIAKKLVEEVISFCSKNDIKISATCSYADKLLALKKLK